VVEAEGDGFVDALVGSLDVKLETAIDFETQSQHLSHFCRDGSVKDLLKIGPEFSDIFFLESGD